MQRALRLARGVAPRPSTVLLQGETGTGKEVIARHIHAISPRAGESFVAINCGAIPSTLVESTLFGHERGAFTGAVDRQIGKFEAAHGGTLLLDEVSELPLEAQARLLRVLQEGELDRVGSVRPVPVDVRVIATSNRALSEMVRAGDFREDLFYRLSVFPIVLPPLRDRVEDLEALVERLIDELCAEFGQPAAAVTPEAWRRLRRAPFPGNIRQLRNVLERALIFAGGGAIEADHICLDTVSLGSPSATHARRDLPAGEASLKELERSVILRTLRGCGGNRTHTADKLGISLRTLRNRLRDYRSEGIEVPEFQGGSRREAGEDAIARPVPVH